MPREARHPARVLHPGVFARATVIGRLFMGSVGPCVVHGSPAPVLLAPEAY